MNQLESIRMLTNHDRYSETAFATVLLGQPTLRRMIKLGVLATLDQRIAVRYQMTGMTPAETDSYVRHDLQLVGRDGDLFSDDAIAQIHEATRGKPRVNNLAVAALIATYAAGRNMAGQAAARAAIAEVIATE